MLKLGRPTRRTLLITLAACCGTAAVVLVAAVALPLVIPSDELRRAASQAITGTTGQKVRMSGDPVLRLLPYPRLSLGKAEFPLPQGQSLDAESVDARLQLWPLLFGQVEVADVTLNRPTLVLTGRSAVPAAALAPLLGDKDLPELRILRGTIALRDDDGLTRELVNNISGSLDRILEGKGIAVALDFDWRDKSVSTKLLMEDTPAFMAGRPTATRVAVSARAARVSFRGETALLRESLAAEGNLSVQASGLREVLAWLGIAAPTSGGFGEFGLSGRLKTDGPQIDLTNAVLDLDGNRSEGALLVKLTGERPLIQGTLAAESLDLSPYGRLRFTSPDGREWDRRTIDLTALERFDLDLRLSAAAVTAENTRLTTLAASAVLTGGRLALTVGQARVWGGRIRASAVLAPRPATLAADRSGAVVRIEADCADVALEPALDDIAGFRRLEGTGDIALSLEGTGRSIQDIAQGISGAFSLTGADGALVGFDVVQVLHRIERRPLSGGGDPRGGRTQFATLDGKITLKDGKADVEAVSFEGKRVRLTLAGTAAVGARDLDLKGTAALVAPAAQGAGDQPPLDLPFIVQGPWDSPLVIADPQSLLQRSGAAQPLIEAVRSRAGAAAVRDIIESLSRTPGALPAANTPAN
ncbi:AsmA family protein [Xanthobacter sp. KR7-225]|uniref:AsmA family protein n=1 Tax=Xanthobacter sp. KR7-225 TaxID=3156613 RepID=UPI0032B43F59